MDLQLQQKCDTSQTPQAPDKITMLEVIYDNHPELNQLKDLASDECCEVLKESLKDGRIRDDFWSLGLPKPEVIQSAYFVDARILRVRAGVVSTDSLNLALERSTASIHRFNIKSIALVNEQLCSPGAPVTTLLDYHRRLQPYRPLNIPDLAQCNNGSFIANNSQVMIRPMDSINAHTPYTARLGMTTPPDSPLRAIKRDTHLLSVATGAPREEDAIRLEIEQEMRADFEALLQERMSELQAAFNQEKTHLETYNDTLRTEFEELLAERLAEVQRDFNLKEKELNARIAQAEEWAEHERYVSLRNEGHVSAVAPRAPGSHCEHGSDFESGASSRETLECQVFAATLEAELRGCRLRDMSRQLEKSEERLAQSRRQLENMVLDLQSAQLELSQTKDRLAVAEMPMKCPDCMGHGEGGGKNFDADILEKLEASEAAACNNPVDPMDARLPADGCPGCDVKQRSLRLSELHVKAMELRVAMFERRIVEAESYAVWLIHALQDDRRRRSSAESGYLAEAQRRRDAEAGAIAISREAESPFVVPRLLDLFLKFEGIVDDVTGV